MATMQQTLAVRRYLEREVTREQRQDRTEQALCKVLPDFYARFTAEEIPPILVQWALAARVAQSPDHPVWLTAEGVKWFHELRPDAVGGGDDDQLPPDT
jgi:hypothetical protein